LLASAGPLYALLPDERRSPNEVAPTARRENSAAAVRSLAGSAGGQLPADRWEI